MGLILILLLLLPLFVVVPDISCSPALTDTVAFTVAFGYSIKMPAANTLEFAGPETYSAGKRGVTCMK